MECLGVDHVTSRKKNKLHNNSGKFVTMKRLNISLIAEHRRVLRGKGKDNDESKQTTSLKQKQQRVEDTQEEAPLDKDVTAFYTSSCSS